MRNLLPEPKDVEEEQKAWAVPVALWYIHTQFIFKNNNLKKIQKSRFP